MNQITQELLRISEANNGILRPEDVLTEAVNKNSPLHDQFTWDDTKAAHEFRLNEARTMIRVCVQLIKSGNKQVSTRVFVSLTNDRATQGGGYRTLVSVMSNAEMRRQLLEDLAIEMERFQENYKTVRELETVFREMKNVQRTLKREKIAA